jgi:predicted O-methyltransferase YrrM
MEIGFNAGHSAETFLQNNPQLNLVSFDLGDHDYISTSKSYIDATGRHTLLLGDSRETVPRFIADNKDVKFDVIFIDGGHQYEIATADIENCFHLANKYTIVMLDDTIFIDGWEKEWTMGPTRAWTEKTHNNKIRELARRNYSVGRGMSWGKYVF